MVPPEVNWQAGCTYSPVMMGIRIARRGAIHSVPAAGHPTTGQFRPQSAPQSNRLRVARGVLIIISVCSCAISFSLGGS